MNNIFYIAAAGECNQITTIGGTVIAADGGYNNLLSSGIIPDLIIGDFDSLSSVPKNVKALKLPVEKDDTDTLFAVKYAIDKGADAIVIFGGMGGRIDHTVANLQTLFYAAEKGVPTYLVAENQIATAVLSSIKLPRKKNGNVGVLCFGEMAEGVTVKGLKYTLDDATLTNSFPLGVSNSFIGKAATVSVKKGKLLVTWQEDTERFIERIVK